MEYGTALYIVFGATLCAAYWFWYAWRDRRFRQLRQHNLDAGLTEPASLHPVIDPLKCIGCGACVAACPEQTSHPVLGIIGGKATLVEPTSCIGHGACRAACPADAITLVFGTERRGIDIPTLSPTFETSVPGIFIAGELGGMGLIRNAIEQGRQALDSIAARQRVKSSQRLDVVIVGAGPAGLSASLRAMELGLRCATVEQDSLGGSVFQFPRGKLVMTAPVDLPIVGKVKMRETSKEALLDFWRGVERDTGLQVKYQEEVLRIEPDDGGFVVTTNRDSYPCASVLLAIGRRGTPRKLGVPGEDLPKVVYRLIDPEQYRGQRVLVVGGGDSALEAATSIAAEAGTTVTLSSRGEAFGRAKLQNRQRVEEAVASGRLDVLFSSQVKAIATDTVDIEIGGEVRQVGNDAVIVSAGGVLPGGFLNSIGVEVVTRHGTA